MSETTDTAYEDAMQTAAWAMLVSAGEMLAGRLEPAAIVPPAGLDGDTFYAGVIAVYGVLFAFDPTPEQLARIIAQFGEPPAPIESEATTDGG